VWNPNSFSRKNFTKQNRSRHLHWASVARTLILPGNSTNEDRTRVKLDAFDWARSWEA
jgi:hypothetical protein